MKNIIVIILLLVAGLLAYNYFTTGVVTLIPEKPSTPEEQELQRLERAFETAAREFNQALRSAGLAGLDTTGDAEAAMNEVKRVERSLQKLMRRLPNETARAKGEKLRQRISDWKRKAGE
jgi:hypothetical protein